MDLHFSKSKLCQAAMECPGMVEYPRTDCLNLNTNSDPGRVDAH